MLDELERAIADIQSLSHAIDTFNDKPGWYARGSIKNAVENLEDAFEGFSTGQKVRRAEVR